MESRCVFLLDILPHPSVMSILNKYFDTQDILDLTRVCKWTYFKWALILKFALLFQMTDRLSKKYGWKFKNPNFAMTRLRGKMTKCVIDPEYKKKSVWCVGGCGKRTNCLRTSNGITIFSHNLCKYCADSFFENSLHWTNRICLESAVLKTFGDNCITVRRIIGRTNYYIEKALFESNNHVQTVFDDIIVYPKKEVESFINKWLIIYGSLIK